MHQIISLGLILATAFLFNAAAAAHMASIGMWGFAVGRLFFAPIIVFYFVHTLVYFVVRLIRGKDRVRSYTRSRLNYVGAVVAILGVLGAAAGPA
ncbi:MAG: hypothetical protein ACK4MH_00120 [Brevundimonas sp.]|uniref:hypothetical protein n=1 Tax=Brevundimonas sp. TaxID=1871086 RepID=UPI00391AB9F3